MKTLVVYYSLEGNTELVAKKIAEETQAELLHLSPKKEYPTGGFKKYLWGGKSVVLGESPELEAYKFNIDEYDKIVIGTPIWASSFAPPIKTFLENNKIEGKEIFAYACHAGGGADKCFAKMKELLKNNKAITTADFKDPKSKQNSTTDEQVKDFIMKMKG